MEKGEEKNNFHSVKLENFHPVEVMEESPKTLDSEPDKESSKALKWSFNPHFDPKLQHSKIEGHMSVSPEHQVKKPHKRTYSIELHRRPDARQVRILVLRHAESRANEASKSLQQLHGKSDILKKAKFSTPELVDALLSEVGEAQCREAAKKLGSKFPHLKYVLLSPMRRAVQTAMLVTEGYPNKLEFHALPHLREVLSNQADVGYHSLEFLQQHPFVDTSMMKADRLWFLDCYEDCPERKLGQLMRDHHDENPASDTLVQIMAKHHPHIEKPPQVTARVKKAKDMIRDFILAKEKEGQVIEDDQILLVSHSRTLRYFCGVYDEEGEAFPESNINFPNAKIRYHYLSVN